MNRAGRRQDGIAIAILAATITILFADVLFGDRNFYLRDIARFHYPTKKVLREIVLAGEFPHWNRYFSAGQPMAANPQHEVFYPPTWLILPGFNTGFHLLILLHLYLAAFGMYAFLRSLGAGPPAAFFAGLSFAIGGLVLSYLSLLPFLFSAVWMPLIFLYSRRFLRHGERRAFALAAFFFGMQLVVGEPTTVLQTGLMLGMYALSSRPFLRRLAGVALLCGAALLMAAVQVLPSIDHFGDSVRSRGVELDVVALWSMPPARVGELLYPDFLGNLTARNLNNVSIGHLYPGRGGPFVASIYPGLLITVLAIAGMLAGMPGARLTMVTIAVSTLLAAGSHTPLLELLYDAGLARSTRYPEKFVLMGVFALIAFGGLAADRLLAGDARVRKLAASISLGAAALAGVAWMTSWSPAFGTLLQHLWQMAARPSREILHVAGNGWLMAAIRGLALLAIVWTVTSVRRSLWLGAAALFILLDLATQVRGLAPTVTSDFYRQPPPTAAEFPANRNEFRIFHYAELPKREGIVPEYRQPHPDSHWRQRNALPPSMPATYGLQTAIEIDYDLTALRCTADFTQAVFEIARLRPRDWINPVAAMSNVWFVGVFERPDVALARAGGRVRDVRPVRFVEGRHHPRYYFAEKMVTIRGAAGFVPMVSSGRFPPSTAFVQGPAFVPATGVVQRWQEWNNGARIETTTSGQAFLVMSVTPHKYWSVSIDGIETTPLVTNLAFQGVIVPPGAHVIDMRYRNPLIRTGGIVSLVSLLGMLVLGWSGTSAHHAKE